MAIYVQNIEITPSGVVVSGQVSATNVSVDIYPYVYVTPPADGIWDFGLSETIGGCFGAAMMVPFRVQVGFDQAKQAKGVRIHLPGGGDSSRSVVQLAARRVAEYTTRTENYVWIRGAHYDAGSNQLVVDVRYAGGSHTHAYALEWNGTVVESIPAQVHLNLVDISEFDPGKAMINTQLRFDLSIPGLTLAVPSDIHLSSPMTQPALIPGPRRPTRDAAQTRDRAVG